MCILEESVTVYPNGQRELLTRLVPCERGARGTRCSSPRIVRLHDQHLPPGILSGRSPYAQPQVIERRPRQVEARHLPQTSGPRAGLQRGQRNTLRLLFDWPLPFCTTRRGRTSRDVINPILPPTYQPQTASPRFVPTLQGREFPPPLPVHNFPPPATPLQPPPLQPPPLQPPPPAQRQPPSPRSQPPPQAHFPPHSPHSTGRPHVQGEPVILPASPRTHAEARMPRPRRPVVVLPPVRDHERRHNQSPSQVRRSSTTRRDRLQDELLERDLAEAFLREHEARIIAEREAQIALRELRAAEAREAVLREADRGRRAEADRNGFDRNRQQRLQRDRRRDVEIHQHRREELGNRGDRVLHEAIRERAHQRRARSQGAERRRWRDDGDIVYDDDRLPGGFWARRR